MNIRRLCGWCALVPLGLLLGCGFTRQHAAKSQVDVVEDQPYVSASPHPKHRLDLYLPKVRHNVPLVLFVHGGFGKTKIGATTSRLPDCMAMSEWRSRSTGLPSV